MLMGFMPWEPSQWDVGGDVDEMIFIEEETLVSQR